eukprot:1672732-Rhodomonas_salina.3
MSGGQAVCDLAGRHFLYTSTPDRSATRCLGRHLASRRREEEEAEGRGGVCARPPRPSSTPALCINRSPSPPAYLLSPRLVRDQPSLSDPLPLRPPTPTLPLRLLEVWKEGE